MRGLKVAAVCMHSVIGEWDRNLRRMRFFASEASQEGAEVLCFPEACASGYSLKYFLPHRRPDLYGKIALFKRKRHKKAVTPLFVPG